MDITPRACSTAARHTSIILLLLFGAAGLSGRVSADWPGWRGGDAQGRSPAPLPTEWDRSKNVAWTVAIPGQGFSSPIVSGDAVYVSTAYQKDGIGAKAVARAALLIAAMLLAAAAVRFIGYRLRDPDPRSLAVAVALLSILCVEAVIIASGESLLDFARCPIRGWLTSAGMATLGVASLLLTDTSRPARRWLIVTGIGLAAAIALAVPTRAHAYRGGYLSANTTVMMAAAAMPLILSCCAAWTLLPTRRTRRRIAAIAVIASAATVFGLAHQLMVSGGGTLPDAESLSPRLGSTAMAIAAGLAIVAVVGWRFRSARSGRVAVVAGACGALLGAGVILLDRFAARSPFLSYHLGSPKLTMAWPSAGSAAIAVVLVVALGVAWRSRRVWPDVEPGWWLRGPAIAVTILFVLQSTVFQTETTLVRALLRIDRATGHVVWTAEAFFDEAEAVDRRNSPATPTPVTDGERVYAYFGNAGLMCVNRQGTVLWTKTGRRYPGYYGIGFSPVLSQGTIVVASSVLGRADITAIDAQSGAERWRREFDTPPGASGNNRTPLIERIGGKPVVLFWDYSLMGFDLATGRTLWQHENAFGGGDLVSSLVSDDERVYLAATDGTRAFRRTELEQRAVAPLWRATMRANCVSPVLCGSRLLTVTDRGVLAAVDRATGALAWRQRLPGEYLASPLAANGLAYFTNTEGMTTVITCEASPKVVAENHLDETVTASAAAADGEIYLRTASTLYCIRQGLKNP